MHYANANVLCAVDIPCRGSESASVIIDIDSSSESSDRIDRRYLLKAIRSFDELRGDIVMTN